MFDCADVTSLEFESFKVSYDVCSDVCDGMLCDLWCVAGVRCVVCVCVQVAMLEKSLCARLPIVWSLISVLWSV